MWNKCIDTPPKLSSYQAHSSSFRISHEYSLIVLAQSPRTRQPVVDGRPEVVSYSILGEQFCQCYLAKYSLCPSLHFFSQAFRYMSYNFIRFDNCFMLLDELIKAIHNDISVAKCELEKDSMISYRRNMFFRSAVHQRSFKNNQNNSSNL